MRLAQQRVQPHTETGHSSERDDVMSHTPSVTRKPAAVQPPEAERALRPTVYRVTATATRNTNSASPGPAPRPSRLRDYLRLRCERALNAPARPPIPTTGTSHSRQSSLICHHWITSGSKLTLNWRKAPRISPSDRLDQLLHLVRVGGEPQSSRLGLAIPMCSTGRLSRNERCFGIVQSMIWRLTSLYSR